MSRLIIILLALLALPVHAAEKPVVLVFGDSLSAGYGIRLEKGWVALLAQRIEKEGYGFQVVNASVSGETTAGGAARLERALEQHKPAVVLLELGGNDGLRGLPVSDARANLEQMVKLSLAAKAKVALLGIRMPPNYGPRYVEDFAAMYPDIAKKYHLPLVPFLLDKVATVPGLMQADGIHPNEDGQPLVLANVWPVIAPTLRGAATAR
jgi:acyl-CoA thioesterase-1